MMKIQDWFEEELLLVTEHDRKHERSKEDVDLLQQLAGCVRESDSDQVK